MRPILLTIGAIEIPSYHVFLLLGLIFGLAAASYAAKHREAPLTSTQIGKIALLVIPFSYLMGMVNGWLFNPVFYRAIRDGQIVLSGGLVSFGAVLGSIIIGAYSAKLLKLPGAMITDLIILAWPLILGFLRIGCLLNGCCHGLETEGLLGMVLPSDYAVWASRYPTQIMLSVFNFGLFPWLWTRRKRTAFEGELTLLYLMVYSTGRLLIDAFRDLHRVFGPFSLHQLIAIIILLSAGIIYTRASRSKRSTSS